MKQLANLPPALKGSIFLRDLLEVLRKHNAVAQEFTVDKNLFDEFTINNKIEVVWAHHEKPYDFEVTIVAKGLSSHD